MSPKETVDKCTAIIPYILNALNNENLDLSIRALRFCLQRVNCQDVTNIIKPIKEVMETEIGLEINHIHSLVILALAQFLICKQVNKDPSENISQVSNNLAKIYDLITEFNVEALMYRLLVLINWTQKEESDQDLNEICDEIREILALPMDKTLESFLDIKRYLNYLFLQFSQNAVKIQPKCSQNAAKMHPKFSQNSVKLQSKCSLNSGKVQTKYS